MVPVIDMSLDEEAWADAIWSAARSPGFFTLVNHGVPSEDIEAAFEASRAFFEGHASVMAKEAASPFAAHLNSGYEYKKQVRPSTGTADQKESLQITARSGAMEGRWPSEPEQLKPAALALLDHSHRLCCRILEALEARACPQLEPGTLVSAHRLWSDDGQSVLRLLHYPPSEISPSPLDEVSHVWRAGPHTDWSCLTLLYQRPGQPGLECAASPLSQQASGGWLRVDPMEGGISVNIGDMLARWSDGRLLSNLHRVRMPDSSDGDAANSSRYSIGFFLQADRHALIECTHSEPITAGDYLLGRIRANFDPATTASKSSASAPRRQYHSRAAGARGHVHVGAMHMRTSRRRNSTTSTNTSCRIAAADAVRSRVGEAEWAQRVELAAAYRLAAARGWDEGIYNHITLAIRHAGHDADSSRTCFLLNQFGLRFDEITASNLVKIDLE